MKKILKVLLLAALTLLCILLVTGLALTLDWPWWMAIFVLLGIAGIWIGIFFLKNVLIRNREERFVREVIRQDDSYLKNLQEKDRERAKELQDRWREAVTVLRRSSLRKKGNPLYVLPWYIVMGESGSGKTTAIQSARLSSPFAEMSRVSGISGTRNCDWWFSEQAVIIDTAGRYAIPVDEARDKEEWQRFLAQLAKFRKKEPLNGLVVSIAADKLLEGAVNGIEEVGRGIRRRIDELMRVVGARFPVYVLVTKCDLIQGMTQFCNRLPEKAYDQAMGFVNRDLTPDADLFCTHCMQTIGTRLRELRLILLHRPGAKGVDPGLLLFPEEFEGLAPGLRKFFKGAFEANPYQETPILRGLFFSSGKQEGSPYSHFLKALGLIGEREVLPHTSKGLFLHDFFSRILPRDRYLFAPTQRALGWSRITRNLGLASWVAIAVAACGLLSFSFVRNLGSLRSISHEFSKPRALQGEILTDLGIMERFREAVLTVESRNLNWWIPRMGLPTSRDVELHLKAKYCSQFREGLLVPMDKQIAERIAGFSAATPGEVIGRHVAYLVRRINLLKARLDGEGMERLQARPQPSQEAVLAKAGAGITPDIDEPFTDLYRHFLCWSQKPASLNKEMNDLQTWVIHILNLKNVGLSWLIPWANEDARVPPVDIRDFWGGPPPEKQGQIVSPAFTRKGKAEIERLVADLEAALPDPLIMARRKSDFQVSYARSYLEVWRGFGARFSEGKAGLKGKEEWKRAASLMADDQGAYFAFLERMATELEPFSEVDEPAGWLKAVFQFRAVRILAAAEAATDDKGTLAKAAKTGKTLIGKLEEKFGRSEGAVSLENRLTAAAALREYRAALAEIAQASASRGLSYRIVAQAFSEDPSAGKSPLAAAQQALSKLKACLPSNLSEVPMFWDWVRGPLEYLWTYTRMETACHLQDLWEREVLVEVQGVSEEQRVHGLLLGDAGYATKYAKGPAGPFLTRTLDKGYQAKRALGESIPFESAFLTFLTKGAAQAVRPVERQYNVTVKGLPTDTNPEAVVRPHATRLEVQCGDQTVSLVNFHYPIQETFRWDPQNCKNVTFSIEAGSLIMTKKYTGDLAFVDFLKEFENGQRTFYPEEFPRQEASLRQMGIKYIKVKYQFSGHAAVLQLATAGPGKAPRTIVQCWEQ